MSVCESVFVSVCVVFSFAVQLYFFVVDIISSQTLPA